MEDLTLTVSEFVAMCNQTMEYAFPVVKIQGEVSEFRISKNKWLYFKLQDGESSVQFFGSVYNLQHAIEDGMLVVVNGTPRLHNRYGFSVNVRTITPSGEGNIKRAFELLKAQLTKEGLFAQDRKRALPYIPKRIGLIASDQSAAYADFMKLLQGRWGGLDILLANVQVQGEPAPRQIVDAIAHLNALSEPVDVLVLIRGGGSAEDLQAFSTESVARSVAGSRTPTVVGVGHETDISLADLAADVRATTPTNAAQLIVPDRDDLGNSLDVASLRLEQQVSAALRRQNERVSHALTRLEHASTRPRQQITDIEQKILERMDSRLVSTEGAIQRYEQALGMVDPRKVLKRGYSLVRDDKGVVVTSAASLKVGQSIMIELSKGTVETEVTNVE